MNNDSIVARVAQDGKNADPFLPNTTPCPNVILDRFMGLLSCEEFKVLMYAVRRTYGFRRMKDRISISQFTSGTCSQKTGEPLDYGTGLSEATVRKALKALVSFGLILRVDGGTITEGPLYEMQTSIDGVKLSAIEAAFIERKQRDYSKTTKMLAAESPRRGEKAKRRTMSHIPPHVTHDGVTPHDGGGATAHDPQKKEEIKKEKTLSDLTNVRSVTAPEPAPTKPEDDPAKRDVHTDALMVSLAPMVETPAPAPRAPHPPGYYVVIDGRELHGPFNNPSAATNYAKSRGGGRMTEIPPADLDAIPPANPGKKTSDAPRPIKRDALFVAVARYLSLPEETPEAPYPATRCKRVNQIKGCVLDVAGRPDKPDYAALAAKLDGFATWCKAQGFSAPKEETKFTGQFNTYYRSANGNGNGGALPSEDFPEKWYSSRMAYYKREGGQLYRKALGDDWRRSGEND